MDYDLRLSEPVHRLFAAPTRRGKSYFVGAAVEQLYQQNRPFILMDAKTDSHIGLSVLPKVKVVLISPKYTYDMKKLNEFPYLLCIPASRDMDIEDICNVYREFMSYMWMQDGERVFIAEEAHNFNKNAAVPDKMFERIAREGAGYGKYLWFVTQRLQNFSQLLWAQCGFTYLWTFNTPTDIRYAQKMIPEFDNISRQLGDHDLLEYDAARNHCEIIRAEQVTRITKHGR